MAGVGLAFGIERVYSVLKDDDLLEGIEEQHDVSVMCLDDKALLLCYDLASALRASGYRVDMMLEAKGFKQQFKRAERKNSYLAAIIGSDELEKEVVILRDLKNQTQIEVPVTHTMEQIHAFFEGQETEHEHGCCCGHDHDEEHECCCGHDHEHHHHHADDVFTSWGKETPHIFERETIEHAMQVFAETQDCGTILRSKGMVQSTDGTWIYFDLVDGEYELRTGEPDYTGRLVVIGTDIDEHKLEELFGIA